MADPRHPTLIASIIPHQATIESREALRLGRVRLQPTVTFRRSARRTCPAVRLHARSRARPPSPATGRIHGEPTDISKSLKPSSPRFDASSRVSRRAPRRRRHARMTARPPRGRGLPPRGSWPPKEAQPPVPASPWPSREAIMVTPRPRVAPLLSKAARSA